MSRTSIVIALLAVASPARAHAQASPETAPGSETNDADHELAEALADDEAARTPPAATGSGVLASLTPDIALIADLAFAWFSTDENLQGGEHEPHENGFALTSLELAIGKAVDPYFRFDAHLVFGDHGAEIEEAFATSLALPHGLQVRAGQFLTRFGRQNPTHPHAWDFADQPFALSRIFGGEGNRGPGVELSWLTPLPWYVEVVASITDARGEESARSFIGGADRGVEAPLDFQNTLALEQFHELSPDLSLLWGLSYATGPSGLLGGHRTHVAGIDAYLKYRPITEQSDTVVALTTEWMVRRREHHVFPPLPSGSTTLVLADLSGYAQVFWRFARRWGVAGRYDYGSAPIDGDGEWIGEYVDPLDPDWWKGRHRASLALTFWPSEFSRLRAQASVDHPRWLPEPILAGFLTLEVAIGAHGAHAF